MPYLTTAIIRRGLEPIGRGFTSAVEPTGLRTNQRAHWNADTRGNRIAVQDRPVNRTRQFNKVHEPRRRRGGAETTALVTRPQGGIGRRRDKLAREYLAWVQIAAALDWMM